MPLTSLVALLACAFSSALQLRSTDPMLPVIAADLSVSLRDAFLLTSAFALPMGAMQFLIGPTADAVGKARVIRTCLAILAATTAISALAESYGTLLLFRVLAGAAAGGVIPMTMALMADLAPPSERQAAFGRVMIAATLGQTLGAAIAGLIVGAVGWRVTYGLMAAVSAVAVTGSLIFFKGDRVPIRPLSLSRAVGDYHLILSSRGALVIVATSICNGALIMGMFPLLAPLIHQRGGDGPAEAGLVIAAFALGGLALGIAVRWMAGRISVPNIVRMGFGLAAMASLATWQPLPWQAIAALYVVAGFGFFGIQNSLLTLISDLRPQARGAAVSLVLFGLFTGQTLGPFVWGLVAEHSSFAFCFAVSSAVLAAISISIKSVFRRGDLPRTIG